MENKKTTLILVNPHAGGGRAGRLWAELEPLIRQSFGDLMVGITQTPDDIMQYVEKAHQAAIVQMIVLGGDGTNNLVVNALQEFRESNGALDAPMTYAQIPIGTGRDFARTLKIPHDPHEAVRWLAKAKPRKLDLGHLTYDDQTCYFLNIASAGISGDVDRRVNQVSRRRPWTFKVATIKSLLNYSPQQVTVTVDGETWFEGKIYIVAVANGKQFGHGMTIAPHAEVDDGLLDVVLVEGMPRLKALTAFNTVYSGSHLERDDVHSVQGKTITISSPNQPLGLDLDGEHTQAYRLHFEVKPSALQMLSGY